MPGHAHRRDPLLLWPRRSPRYQSRPTTTAQILWEILSYSFHLPLATRRLHLQSKNALGDAAELLFADSVRRYSHADWEREQQAKPTYHAAMRYITIGRPPALPPDFLSCYPSHQPPSLSDIQKLVGKRRVQTFDNNIVLLVRNPTPPSTPDAPSSVGRAAC